MRKITVLFVVLMLLVVSSAPVLAAGKGPDKSGPFVVSGTITGLDSSAGTITIQVDHGDKRAKPLNGKEVTIQTKRATRFLLMQPDSKPTRITFGQLVVGQKVRAQGVVVKGTWTARSVNVWGAPSGGGGGGGV